MPSLSSTLEKLHIRRKSTSSSPSSPIQTSPTRQNNSRRSFDLQGSPAGRGSASRLSSDAVVPPGRNSSMAESSEAMDGLHGIETAKHTASVGLPRSQKQYTLPPIPPTPLEFEGGQEGLLAGPGPSISAAPPRLPAIEGLGGMDVETVGATEAMSEASADENSRNATNWTATSQAQPFEVHHDLGLPTNAFPVTIPEFPYDETSAKMSSELPAGFHPMQPTHRVETSALVATSTNRPKVDLAFVADHYTRVGFPTEGTLSSTTNEAEHLAHLQKHLSLLSPRIFTAGKLSRGLSARNTHATKVIPLKAGPVVPYVEAEAELNRQRDSLIDSIVNSNQHGRGHASAALSNSTRTGESQLEIDPRKKVVFDSIGWTERLGILDTIDVHTTYLEPVIQEHVQPIEHNIYTTLIYREIHRYHIYPYIQPIADPNPKILPTRHLFLDESISPTADGRKAYRVIYGDAAAEEVLGRKLTGEDRQHTTYERWIEGVDGIEYEKMEAESVEVGKRGWVERVGQTMDGEVVEWYAKLQDYSRENEGVDREVDGIASTTNRREMVKEMNGDGPSGLTASGKQVTKTSRTTNEDGITSDLAI